MARHERQEFQCVQLVCASVIGGVHDDEESTCIEIGTACDKITTHILGPILLLRTRRLITFV